MSSASTFGTFTMARLGIYVSQQALNTTGNNISNINTEGYTRQKLDQTSMTYGAADRYSSIYDVRANGGVLATGVDQMRDQYLDIRYRNEMTRVGEMDARQDGLSQLSVIFDEVAKGDDGEGVLEARFNNLAQQLETMLQDYNVGRNTNDSIVREAAEELAIQFNDYAKQLETLEANMIAKFKDNIDTANTTLTKIRDLNETIRRAQIFGSSATTQKDERNLLIDQLSEQVGINVIYEMEDLGDGVEVEKLRITTSGDPTRTLIDGLYGAQLSIVQEPEKVARVDSEGMPVKDSNGNQIYDWALKDNANFDLAISELTDARGKVDPKYPNKTETALVSFEDPAKAAAGSVPVNATAYATLAEAVKAANELNTNPAYYENQDATVDEATGKIKGYYYHVADANGNDPDETNADPTLRTSPPYYIHIHETEYDPAATESVQLAAREANKIESDYAYAQTAKVTKLTDTELSGGVQAQRELLTESGEYATDETIENIDPEAGSKRGIPYYKNALDTLARTFAEKMNEANRLTDDIIYKTNADGAFLGADGATYTKKEDGTFTKSLGGTETTVTKNEAKTQFQVKEEYKKYFKQDSSGAFLKEDDTLATDPTEYVPAAGYEKYFGGNLFSVSGDSNQDGTNGDNPGDTKITAANISISYDWSHGKLHVLTTIDPDADTMSRASDNLAHIVTMLSEKHQFTTGSNTKGTTYFKGTFQEMLTDTIAGTLAKDKNITETMLKNYNATADTLYIDRDAVMGVDLNDEAMNMMQFQKAYSAACRLMTTYDDMLEKLINGTAI